jgi:hypothetical protein
MKVFLPRFNEYTASSAGGGTNCGRLFQLVRLFHVKSNIAERHGQAWRKRDGETT